MRTDTARYGVITMRGTGKPYRVRYCADDPIPRLKYERWAIERRYTHPNGDGGPLVAHIEVAAVATHAEAILFATAYARQSRTAEALYE